MEKKLYKFQAFHIVFKTVRHTYSKMQKLTYYFFFWGGDKETYTMGKDILVNNDLLVDISDDIL